MSRRSDLPPVPSQAGALRPVLEAMREIMVTGEGHRGDPLDRKLTLRDLIGSGIGTLRPGSRPGVGGLVPTNPAPNRAVPPAPTGFQAVSVFGFITLIWDRPSGRYGNHALTNIYRSDEDNFANALLVARDSGFSYSDPMRSDLGNPENPTQGAGFYYWITWVSDAGVEGPPNSPNGTYVEATPDVEWLAERIGGQIDESWLSGALKERIDGIEAIDERVTELRERIENLSDAMSYDPDRTYEINETVHEGQHLYQAKGHVPTKTPPPNDDYWTDVGQAVREANALGFQVSEHSVSIERIEGKVSVHATSLDALRAAWTEDDGLGELADAVRGYESSAQYVQEVRTRASETEAGVERTTILSAELGQTRSSLLTLEQTVSTNNSAVASQLSLIRTDLDGKQATLVLHGQSIDGLAASYVVKTDVNGHVAGYGHYNDGTTADFAIVADRFWIASPGSADKVKPFMTINNVNYLDTVMIRDASIQEGKLGAISFGKLVDANGQPITTVAGKLKAENIDVDNLNIGFAQLSGNFTSDNYVPGQLGFKWGKDGTYENNGKGGSGRRESNNLSERFFDAAGTLRLLISVE